VLHLFLYGLLAVLLAGGLFLLASKFLPAGEQIAPPLRDEPPWALPPERALRAEDVDGVRLPVALRGYRFAETDLLLDRLAAELRARDVEIARLRGEPVDTEPAPPAEESADEQGVEPETEHVSGAAAEDAAEPVAEPVAEPGGEPVGRHSAPPPA